MTSTYGEFWPILKIISILLSSDSYPRNYTLFCRLSVCQSRKKNAKTLNYFKLYFMYSTKHSIKLKTSNKCQENKIYDKVHIQCGHFKQCLEYCFDIWEKASRKTLSLLDGNQRKAHRRKNVNLITKSCYWKYVFLLKIFP